MIQKYVYILRCADGTFYTGSTNDVEARLKRHRAKYVRYTSSRLPVELVTYIAFTKKQRAYDFERYLKTGSGAAFFKKRLV